MQQHNELTPDDTVIIVAYHLPVTVKRTHDGNYEVEWDDDRGLHKDGMNLSCHCIYVGCIGLEVSDLGEQERIEKLLLHDYSCVVLFLEPELTKNFYHGFCRTYLTPIMHNQMHIARASDPFQKDEWRAYCHVNRLFAAKVMEVYSPGHIIWVHDYHLLLLPSCILRKLRTAKIGLFLHTPFPSSDVWRSIAVRHELLRSLLNADLIGFLLFEHARNFLTCCKRALGLEYEFQKGGFLGVEYEGRHVMLQVGTFGISPSTIKTRLSAMTTPEGLPPPLASELGDPLIRACSSGNVVIAGVEYLDRLKGVTPKLLAWEALLIDYPAYRIGHTLVQVCIGARNRIQIQSAGEIESEIRSVVDRINGAFPGAVHLDVRAGLSPAARLHLWCSAEVQVVTALKEAINVWPLEFVMARHLRGLPPGVLVLSEFTGFARVLNGGLRVNPNSQTELVEALDNALTMEPGERSARGVKDLAHIERCTLEEFARRFVGDLKSCSTKTEEDYMSVGFGLASFRMVGMGADFKPLDTVETVERFQSASHRALLLDWGGTLTPADAGFYDHRATSDGCAIPERVLSALGTLCADPKNHVMILSGLSKEKVLSAFGSVPNLSLAVEHGYVYRIKDGPWQELMPGLDTSWRPVAESVMNLYATRTHGAYVQAKGSSMSFNFQEADPEYGAMQGKEMQFTLQNVLAKFPVVVRTGKGYVEACLKDVNKGAMAAAFVDSCEGRGGGGGGGLGRWFGGNEGSKLDFVFCAGDDSTDELMFGSLKQKLGKAAPQLFTTTVGRKPSEASSYLNDHNEVVELLELMCSHGSPSAGGMSRGISRSGASLTKSGASLSGGNSSSHFNLASLA